jgi:hypothetical protein
VITAITGKMMHTIMNIAIHHIFPIAISSTQLEEYDVGVAVIFSRGVSRF